MTQDVGTVDDGLGDIAALDGPWDAPAAPSDAAFLDFGALKVPAIQGLKARVEVDAASNRIGAVSVKVAKSSVQLQVIAARSGDAAWPGVRRAIIARLAKGPGHQQVMEGRFGPEIIATITARDSGGLLHDVPMRLIGIDGPRWLLRAVVTGPDCLTDATTARVDALLSQCAIERGDEARPAGEVIELAAPPGYLSFWDEEDPVAAFREHVGKDEPKDAGE